MNHSQGESSLREVPRARPLSVAALLACCTVLALVLAIGVALLRRAMPRVRGNAAGGYWDLLCNLAFQRYALSQGLSVGALL